MGPCPWEGFDLQVLRGNPSAGPSVQSHDGVGDVYRLPPEPEPAPQFHVHKGSLRMVTEQSAVPARILLVEDDTETRQMLSVILSVEGYQVAEAEDGQSALRHPTAEVDLVVLDWMLPDISGIEVCRRIRRSSLVPILMLTGRTDTADKVLGLNIGADDYMEKPFEPGELVARVRALLRRASLSPSRPKRHAIASGILHLDPDAYEVSVRGANVPMTRLEFDLLYCLVENAGKVLSRMEILKLVWGEDDMVELRGIDAHIRRIRKKIEEQPDEPRQILSVYGVGYKYVPLSPDA